MAGKHKGLIERDGRFYARLVIPADLRPHLECKTELRAPLGGERRIAIQNHPRALADLQDRIDAARRAKSHAEGVEAAKIVRARSPMSDEEIARDHYRSRLAFDEELRNDPRYASVEFDDGVIADLRNAIAGRATDDQLAAIVGSAFRRYQQRGNVAAEPGTFEARKTMRALAVAEYEALARAAERDEGDFSGKPEAPILKDFEIKEPAAPGVPLTGLLEAYLNELAASGMGTEARRRWTPVFKQLVEFLKHDDASRLTKADVIRWKDHLLTRFAPKTIRDSHLGSLKAVLNWAHDNEKIAANPAQGVKLKIAAKKQGREKGFTAAEATALLQAVDAYAPKHSSNPQTRESAELTAAKRWAPWLAAHTGARIAELMQLRKEDVRKQDGVHYLRITPDAGSVKTGQFRDVPIHPQLIERGFLQFVSAAGQGPLFFRQGERDSTRHPSKYVAQRLAGWLRTLPEMPAEVDPSHGWRHRMKTVGRELRIDPRVIDAIQGHAARTAGENYGDVTLQTKRDAINRLPRFSMG